MPDELTQPEDLIQQISGSAAEFAPVEASAFREIALENIATFREQVSTETAIEIRLQVRLREVPSPRFFIPDKYSESPEVFLVFDAFVGVFLEPLEAAVSAMNLLSEFELNQIAFARPREDPTLRETIRINQNTPLRNARLELREIATDIGVELFGPKFVIDDFSAHADTI